MARIARKTQFASALIAAIASLPVPTVENRKAGRPSVSFKVAARVLRTAGRPNMEKDAVTLETLAGLVKAARGTVLSTAGLGYVVEFKSRTGLEAFAKSFYDTFKGLADVEPVEVLPLS